MCASLQSREGREERRAGQLPPPNGCRNCEQLHAARLSPRWESLKVCYHKPATMWRGGLDRSLPHPRKRGVLIERSAPRLFLGVPTALADHQRGWHTERNNIKVLVLTNSSRKC